MVIMPRFPERFLMIYAEIVNQTPSLSVIFFSTVSPQQCYERKHLETNDSWNLTVCKQRLFQMNSNGRLQNNIALVALYNTSDSSNVQRWRNC